MSVHDFYFLVKIEWLLNCIFLSNITSYGRKILSLILREEYRLRMSENRVLRWIVGPKIELKEAGERCIMMRFIQCMLHQILLG
jgi:hypothetical protein